MEYFKDLPGYEDLYSVSNKGAVFSKRRGRNLKHDISKVNKIHSIRLVDLGGSIKKQSIPRIMAITFLKNPNESLYNNAINKNGNHNDLRLENIMWGTSSQHVRRKYKRNPDLLNIFLTSSPKTGNRKITHSQELDMITMYNIGYSAKQLEDIFPIKKGRIFQILRKYKSPTECYQSPL